jgi:hypothetical protein
VTDASEGNGNGAEKGLGKVLNVGNAEFVPAGQSTAACAAASRAIGTRNGEQLT